MAANFFAERKQKEQEREKEDNLLVAEFVSKEFTPLLDCFYKNMRQSLNDEGRRLVVFQCPLTRDYSDLRLSKKKKIENRIEDELRQQGWNTRYIYCLRNSCSEDKCVAFFYDQKVHFSVLLESFRDGEDLYKLL